MFNHYCSLISIFVRLPREFGDCLISFCGSGFSGAPPLPNTGIQPSPSHRVYCTKSRCVYIVINTKTWLKHVPECCVCIVSAGFWNWLSPLFNWCWWSENQLYLFVPALFHAFYTKQSFTSACNMWHFITLFGCWWMVSWRPCSTDWVKADWHHFATTCG